MKNTNYLKEELYELIKTDESIFDFIQESCLDGLCYWDLEHPEEKWMNPKFWSVLGYDHREMPHKASVWQDIIHPDDLKLATENLIKHCENPNHPYDQTVRYTHKSGATVWIRYRGLAIRDKHGKALRMLVAHQEITGLKNNEKRLNYALDASGYGIWDWTPADGKTVYSKAWVEMLGYEVGELASLASEWADRLHPDDAEWVFAAINKVTQTPDNGDTFRLEYRFKNKTGDYLWILNKAKVVERNEKGEASRVVGTHTNITERKQAEEEIKRTTILLEAAQHLAKMGAWELDLATGKTFWTEEVYKIHEVEKDFDHNKANGIEFYHPDYRPIISKAITDSIEKQIPFDVKCKFITAKNNLRWVHASGYPIIKEGKVTHIVGMFKDITQEEADKEVIAQEQLFSKQLLENMADGFSVVDIEGRQIGVNKAFCEMTGFSEEELIGQTAPHPYWPAEELEDIGKAFQKTLEGDLNSFELIFQKKNGERFPVLLSTSVLKDEGGNAINYFANVKDITEQKRKEAEIATISKEVKDITNAINENSLVSITDNKGKIILANKKFCELSGYTENELLGQNHRIINSGYHDKQFWLNLWQTITAGKVWKGEVKNRAKDGSEYWVDSIIQPIMDDSGKIVQFLSIRQDITDRKKAELALQESEKKFRELFENLIDEVHLWKIVKDKTGKITGWQLVDANLSALKSWGKSINEIIGKTANEIFGIDAHTQFMPIVEEIFKTYKPYHWENYFAPTDQYLQMESIPFGDYFISTGKDITERKKEHQQLKLLESVITNTKDSVLITEAEPFDEPGPRIIYVNEAFTKMTGYTAEEVIGKTPRILQGPNSDKEALAKLSKALRKWESHEITTINYKKSGEEFWINFSVTPVADETGWYTHWIAIERDITEQKKAEQALKDSEMRLSLAAQAGGVGVWDWDIVKNILTWDDQMFALYGIKRENFSNAYEAWIKGVYEADRELVDTEIELAIKGEKEFNTEFRIQRPNGEIRNVRTIGTVVRDAEGNAIRMVGTNWDITKEQEALRQIEEAQQKLKSIFDGMQDVIWAVDADTFKTIFVTPSAEDFYGYTINEWYSNAQLWSEVIIDEYKHIIPQIFKNLEEEGFSQTEYKIKTKSGALKWVKNRAKAVKENGVVTRFEGVIIDITKEKEALRQIEEARKQAEASEGRLVIAQGVAKVGSWETDLQTLEVVWSEETYKIFGTDNLRFQASHTAFLEFVHPADKEKVDKAFLESFTKAGINTVEHRIITVDNIVKHVEERWQIHSDLNGKPTRAVGTCQDITERKLAENELRLAKQQAEAANKAKSEFLANMSHEIRTPLNGVIGFTELLSKTPLNPVQQQYADSANVSGHTLLGIINDILDFSKIEAGMLEFEVMKTDMVALLEDSIDIVKFSAADKALELLLDIDPSMPRFAHLDAIRTKQILANLLGNAIKFTHKGEVALKTVYQALDGKQGKLSISVRDTGIGITEEQKAKLFKSFSQADSSTTRKYGGTGLGLVISQMIAEKMGSKINIDSTADVGTTFYFDIIMHFEEGEKPDATQIIGVKRCLIIDDNDNNRLILEQMLKQWQIASDSCSNGLEALKKVENAQPYDVIICDYDMPYLNGLDTIRLMKDKLKMSTEKQPVILLHSSIDNAALNQKCKELGIHFRLTKPVKSQDLFNYLSHLNQTTETIPQEETAQTVHVSQTSEKIKILIVEDNPLNMVLSKTMLSQLMPNSEVYEARNGLEAIEQYQSISPDLIFMDVHMPELDGIEATKKIRALEVNTNNRLPIVALTADVLKEEKDKCLAAGMDEFLTKPLESVKIQTVLNKFFRQGKKTNADLENIAAKNNIHFGFSELAGSLDNDMEMVQMLMSMFITDIPTRIDRLEQACNEIDLANIKAIAHSIKGDALAMRCNILADIARKIENAIKDNSLENLKVLLTEFKEEWDIVKHLLLQKINH